MSMVSVAEHMANRKPPPSTYWRIFRATACFIFQTASKPRVRAMSSVIPCCSTYQAA